MKPKSKTTRRQFLAGRSALDAIADLPSQFDPEVEPASDAPANEAPLGTRSYLVQVARDAMACQFQVLLNAGQHTGAVEAAIKSLDLVEAIEDQLTVYRPHSEVSRINRREKGDTTSVDSGLFRLLQKAQQIHSETGGAFDVTAGPLSKIWGFHRREGRLPTDEVIRETLQRVGAEWLRLDADRQTLSIKKEGVEINLGGIGKGYALDCAGDELRQAGVSNFLIHGGHSSVLAAGSRLSGNSTSSGWRVAIRHPLRHDIRLAEVTIRDRALGTSGSGNQFFHFGGRRYGHVLDPRTGYPAEGVLSATVLAPTATEADALSTAFFVMGRDKTLEFCQTQRELAVILICAGPEAGSVRVESFGLDSDEWILTDEG